MNTSTDRTRFARALAVVGATNPGDAVFDDLMTRYREEHRHYHTAAHVEACVRHLCRFGALAENASEIELALWFHDAIYDPRRSANETRSAALAREQLGSSGVPADSIDRIAEWIEATRSHETRDGDGALLVDLDLSILGATPETHARFESQIRAEYAHVPEEAFRAGRRRILEGFAARTTLYRVPEIAAEWERPARENLARRIRELGGAA